MWRFFAGLLMGSVAAAPAVAAEWWWVAGGGDKPNRHLEFVDKSSITSDYAGRVSAWVFQIHEIPQKEGERKSKALIGLIAAIGR